MVDEAKKPVVGFIGLGTMGTPMATCIARGGYQLRLHDSNATAVESVGRELGQPAGTSSEVLADASIIITMLPNSAIVRKALVDDDNRLNPGIAPGTLIIDMSSSDPTETVETAKILATHDVVLVDAPVSGARERAIDGTLAVMLGGEDEEVIAVIEPVLECMSSRIHRTGVIGSGHAMKAINNYIAGAAFAASCEGLILGRRFGLDQKAMVDVLNESTGRTWFSTNILEQQVLSHKYDSGFALPLLTKDIKIASKMSQHVDFSGDVLDATTHTFDTALDSLGPVDHTQLYRNLEDRSRR